MTVFVFDTIDIFYALDSFATLQIREWQIYLQM